jgi:hypothetical protein
LSITRLGRNRPQADALPLRAIARGAPGARVGELLRTLRW